jgi:hypothetical protein
MTQYSALLSIVYMIVVVLLFDRLHRSGLLTRFCKDRLLSSNEVDQLRQIMDACQEG